MTIPSVLIALVIPYALMLVVPGPNALIVFRASLQASLLTALVAASGIACGATCTAAFAAAFAAAAPAGKALRVVGALVYAIFLMRSALRMMAGWTDLSESASVNDTASAGSHFGLGFVNALLNPVTAPFFIGFFVGHPCGRATAGFACLLVFVMAVGYFSLLGITLATVRRRMATRPPGRWLQVSMATTMVFFAAHAVWRAALA